MADSGKPAAEAYNASSVAGEKTPEGAHLPEPLWDDPDYVRREREWNRTAGSGWPHPEADESTLRGGCPDTGACHHSCLRSGPCFRVLACSPLSAWGDRWPPDLVARHRELDRQLSDEDLAAKLDLRRLDAALAVRVTSSLLEDLPGDAR
jgi:hypothetical protein